MLSVVQFITTPMENGAPGKIILASCLFIVVVSGCKKTDKLHASTAVILSGSNPGLNTCGWIVRVNEGVAATSLQNSFKPTNLDQQFQTDGIQVNIT